MIKVKLKLIKSQKLKMNIMINNIQKIKIVKIHYQVINKIVKSNLLIQKTQINKYKNRKKLINFKQIHKNNKKSTNKIP